MIIYCSMNFEFETLVWLNGFKGRMQEKKGVEKYC